MSATHSTTNYNLPIFIASDSPKWLVDWNGAMNTIDSAINTVATAASGAVGDITSLQSDLQTLSGTVTTQGTSISTLTSSLSTLTGTVNTITSLIGNGEPTTTDKTIIGAINELHSDIQQIVVTVDADDVSYDNTGSGLTATNVQDAIDEIAGGPTTHARRVLVISDSYGKETNGNDPFTDYLGTYLGLSTGNYIDFSQGGMGYYKQGGNNTNALEFLTSLSSSIDDHDTITDIVFGLGINDYEETAANIKSAVNSLLGYCKIQYPNAKCWGAYIGNTKNKNAVQYASYIASIKAIEEAYGANGFPVMGGAECIMHDLANAQSDGVHPTTDGAKKIAEFLADYLNGGSPVYRGSGSFNLTGDIDYTIEYQIDGEITTLLFNKTTINNAVPVTDRSVHAVATSATPLINSAKALPILTQCEISDHSYHTIILSYLGGTVNIVDPSGNTGLSIPVGATIYNARGVANTISL